MLPGTQTLKPGVAVKFVFPNSEKLRPTVDGSFPQQTGTSRTAWTPINELRYRTDRINEVIALAIVHDIGSADLQDYIKAFTQLRRHPSELSLYCRTGEANTIIHGRVSTGNPAPQQTQS